jgi:hypothetical protein
LKGRAEVTVTPIGVISGPLKALADLLAASETFQAWAGASDAAGAAAHVKRGLFDPDLLAEEDYPLAFVNHGAGGGTHKATGGGLVQVYAGGDTSELTVFFVWTIPQELLGRENQGDAETQFTNDVGAILSGEQGESAWLDGLEDLSGLDGNLVVTEFRYGPPERTEEAETVQRMMMEVTVTTGV